mgnify:FL=1
MYALENVKKFVQNNAGRLGERAEVILARAEEKSHDGVFSGGAVEEIMQDDGLAVEFHNIVMSDPDHMQIGLSAMQATR